MFEFDRPTLVNRLVEWTIWKRLIEGSFFILYSRNPIFVQYQCLLSNSMIDMLINLNTDARGGPVIIFSPLSFSPAFGRGTYHS